MVNARHEDEHVTGDQLRAGLTEVRTEVAGFQTELAGLETRLITWMIATVITVGGNLRIIRLFE